VIAGVIALCLSACGSSSSSSSTTTAASSGGSSSSSSGSGTKSPGTRTIGVIPSTSSSENLAVWIAQLKAAAAPLGWKVIVCNGNGNPATMEQCGTTFVTQKVDAIVTMALGGPEIPNTFKQAKAAGIPVFAEGTSVNPGYDKIYSGVFGDDIVKMGQITADWLAKNAKGTPIVGLQITQNYGGQGYVIGVKAGLAHHGLKYTDLRDTNLADIVNSMKSTSQAIVQAHPGKMYFIGFNDIDPLLQEPVYKQLGRQNDVTLITRYDDPSTVKIMKSGAKVLISNTKDWQHIFDMLNALLNHWVNNQPLPNPATTQETPGAGVYSINDFPAGASRQFPFEPALKAQEAEWAKTYKLQSSDATAP
jgi:ABC-type sugar transport system substrate-binding protein